MRRPVWIVGITLFVCQLATAEQLAPAEVFGGYSHYWQSTRHIHGWDTSAAANVNKWFGLVGNISAHYFPEETFSSAQRSETSSIDQYRIYAGPRFSIRRIERLTPSFHLLLGIVHSRREFSGISVPGYPFSNELVPFSGSESNTDFSGAIGGALDVRANERIAFRIIQADYVKDAIVLFGRSSGLRMSFGVVFGIGAK